MLTKSDIDWLKSELLPALTETVKNALAEKLDAINTKLDKFVGEIETKRTEQKLHAGQHREINDTLESHKKRFERLEKSSIIAP